jgi:hypothetical protein
MSEPAQDATAEPEGTEERITAIETTLQRFGTILEGLAGSAHGQAADATAARLDRPSSVEEQARAAVEQALADRDAKDRQDTLSGSLAAVQADVASLKEGPPARPERRIEKFMRWGG